MEISLHQVMDLLGLSFVSMKESTKKHVEIDVACSNLLLQNVIVVLTCDITPSKDSFDSIFHNGVLWLVN